MKYYHSKYFYVMTYYITCKYVLTSLPPTAQPPIHPPALQSSSNPPCYLSERARANAPLPPSSPSQEELASKSQRAAPAVVAITRRASKREEPMRRGRRRCPCVTSKRARGANAPLPPSLSLRNEQACNSQRATPAVVIVGRLASKREPTRCRCRHRRPIRARARANAMLPLLLLLRRDPTRHLSRNR